ncbi:hypothetical protein [Haloprofundus sp. MHR1]|uniref:hypothetical protein n=1 Tax=Haloprofundus sp. MHR1 TaxID=2572921 RepID=UPI0010BF57C6|nr:hypothetical protein [Haloprofundus sp. MHR1]QCJ47694.1 hypothetical protein FCF25_11435 [Haloprofundus sp. MHR1]
MVSVFISETVLCTPGSGIPQTLFGVLLLGFALVWGLANRGGPWLGQPSLSLVLSAVTSLLGLAAFLFGLLLTGAFDDPLGYGGFGCGVQWVYLPAAAMSLAGALLLFRTGRRIWRTK